MRLFLFAILIGFSSLSYAAKFDRIGRKEIAHTQLQELADFWQEGPGKHTDVYFAATQILLKRDSEPYKHSLMQILWGSYTYEVSVEEATSSKEYFKKEINFLFDASTWLQNEASVADIKSYKNKLLKLLLDISQNSEVLIFTGVIEGDFSSSFVHISMIDLKNHQTLSLIGGYSE